MSIGNDLRIDNELELGNELYSEFSGLINNVCDFNKLKNYTYPTKYSFQYHNIDFINHLNSIKIPMNYKDALRSPQCDQWIRAMKEEMASLTQKQVFKFVKQGNEKLLSTMWVYALKNENGKLRYKARLVARGDCQTPGQYGETHSPTVEFSVLRMLLLYAMKHKLLIWNLDIKTAFLNADLNEDIFIKPPSGFNFGNDLVIKLMKSLYGLRQAGHNWFKKLKTILESIGFRSINRETTLFVHEKIPNLIICVYVDDLLVLAPSIEIKDRLIIELTRLLDLHDRGPLTEILGVKFEWIGNDLYYHQKHLIIDLIERFEIQPNPKIQTPLPGNDLSTPMLNGQDCDQELYSSIIGSLLYIARISRPEILFPVIQMSQFRQTPKVAHLRKLYRILVYLRNTIDFKLNLKRDDNDLAISVYTDSSFNTNHDLKNFNGSVVYFGKSLVHWSCNKMRFSVLSTDEAEIIGCLSSLRQLLYFKYLFCEMIHSKPIQLRFPDLDDDSNCVKCTTPILYVDNKGSISFCTKGFGKRTKYLSTKFNFLIEQFQLGTYQVLYVNTKSNVADIFTKNLVFELFDTHRNSLFN